MEGMRKKAYLAAVSHLLVFSGGLPGARAATGLVTVHIATEIDAWESGPTTVDGTITSLSKEGYVIQLATISNLFTSTLVTDVGPCHVDIDLDGGGADYSISCAGSVEEQRVYYAGEHSTVGIGVEAYNIVKAAFAGYEEVLPSNPSSWVRYTHIIFSQDTGHVWDNVTRTNNLGVPFEDAGQANAYCFVNGISQGERWQLSS